jgi:hypothetical protein
MYAASWIFRCHRPEKIELRAILSFAQKINSNLKALENLHSFDSKL